MIKKKKSKKSSRPTISRATSDNQMRLFKQVTKKASTPKNSSSRYSLMPFHQFKILNLQFPNTPQTVRQSLPSQNSQRGHHNPLLKKELKRKVLNIEKQIDLLKQENKQLRESQIQVKVLENMLQAAYSENERLKKDRRSEDSKWEYLQESMKAFKVTLQNFVSNK